MATKNGRAASLQDLVKTRLGEAEKQLKSLQAWAGKFTAQDLKTLEAQARVELTRRAGEARKQITELQDKARDWVGAASQAQFKHLQAELTRLAKKVDKVVGRRGSDA